MYVCMYVCMYVMYVCSVCSVCMLCYVMWCDVMLCYVCMYNIDQPLWCRCDATSTLCRCDATSTLWYALKARLLVSSCIIRTNVVYNRSEHVITLISYMFCVLKEACRINLRHWGMLPTQLWRQRLGMGGGRKPQAHPCKHQNCENVLICSTGCHEVFSMDVEFQPRPREQIHQAWKVVSGKELSKFHQRRLWTLPCNEPCLGWLIFQCLSTKVIFPGPAEDWRDYKGINMYEKSSIIRAKACQNVAILCNPEWYSKGVLSNHGRITGLRILQVHTKSLMWILSAHSQICKFLAKEIKRENRSDHAICLGFRQSLPKQQPCPPQVWPPTLSRWFSDFRSSSLWQPTGQWKIPGSIARG